MIDYDDRDDGRQAMYYEELERDTLEVLDRCARAGAQLPDLQFLAAMLGVGDRFQKAHAPGR